MPELMSLIRQYAGDDVSFYYHIPYGHAKGDVFGYSDWCKIIETTRQMTVEMGVDKLIPTGTAIQKARNTTLSGAYNLTRDDWHLNAGVGRYIAACTWYEALLAPYFGVSVNGADWTMPEKLSSETGISDNGNFEAVTDENKAMCQSCAVQAIENPYTDDFCYTDITTTTDTDNSIIVYPNPTSNILHIKAECFKQVCIYDINGSLLLQTTEKVLNVQNFPTGIYFYKIELENSSSSSSFFGKLIKH